MAQTSGYSLGGTSAPSKRSSGPQIINAKETVESTSPSIQGPLYKAPQTPLFRALPEALIPYAELMRLHKPAGYYAFLFPHLVGTLLAASCGPSTPSLQRLGKAILAHVVANLFLRGAACSYNDALDAPFDRLVERCRHRPVARGAVSPLHATMFAFAQGILWVMILAILLPDTIKPAILLGSTMLVYPWCKRITNYPQVVLGFSLACGQGIGSGVIGWDITKERNSSKLFGIAALYLCSVLNAIIYDTVYAYQDIQDDINAGVMSMAIACAGWTKQWLSLLSFLEVMLLATAGYTLGLDNSYWIMSVGGTATVLICMLKFWRIDDRANCWFWFCHLIWLTGGTICAGLAGEYAQKLLAV